MFPAARCGMLAFDRIPWPRPTILAPGARDGLGGRNYGDDMLARLADWPRPIGRLIRRPADDKGVFCWGSMAADSDPRFGAFPETVACPNGLGLVDAIRGDRGIFGE